MLPAFVVSMRRELEGEGGTVEGAAPKDYRIGITVKDAQMSLSFFRSWSFFVNNLTNIYRIPRPGVKQV